MHKLVRTALYASSLIALFALNTAGLPTNGLPTNGLPTNGLPTNGLPTNGLPTNGLPTNGANLDALENSLLFGNAAVHQAFIGHPFIKAALTDASSPLYQIWFDPFSALLASYLWQDAHALGDDLEFTEPTTGKTFRFYGNVGACDQGGHGWAHDAAQDDACAHWISALIITQVNQLPIHNLFSARGPSGKAVGFIGTQLTDMAPAIHSFEYKFGTHDPVEAVQDACADGTTGPENCGWQPGLVGVCRPGAKITVALASGGERMLVQINQGIMAHDYPWAAGGACAGGAPGCADVDFLGADVKGVVNPSVKFTCPPSGVFNAQWTPYDRKEIASGIVPIMKAAAQGKGTVKFPADELKIFHNREMTARGNIFGKDNIDPALWSCEARLVFNTDQRVRGVQLCEAGREECVSCTRPFQGGGQHVVFPNAHMWLSMNWTNAQDYYRARSCSSDLSTCIASLEGFIDAVSFNAASASLVQPCQVQSADRDSHQPLPYPGRGRPLRDADFCFVGSAVQPSFDVTTFFPNYRGIGACAAVGTSALATCAYAPPGSNDGGEDDDDEEDRD